MTFEKTLILDGEKLLYICEVSGNFVLKGCCSSCEVHGREMVRHISCT